MQLAVSSSSTTSVFSVIGSTATTRSIPVATSRQVAVSASVTSTSSSSSGTASVASETAPTSTAQVQHHSGLSAGASAGIGVGVGLGVLALLAAGLLLFLRRRRQAKTPLHDENGARQDLKTGFLDSSQSESSDSQELDSPQTYEMHVPALMPEMQGSWMGQELQSQTRRQELPGDLPSRS
ncbi:hypothetical protein MRB53_039288 [Persea americana]|nr:hypothetical protein MRB53_039288 [Persea americana]